MKLVGLGDIDKKLNTLLCFISVGISNYWKQFITFLSKDHKKKGLNLTTICFKYIICRLVLRKLDLSPEATGGRNEQNDVLH